MAIPKVLEHLQWLEFYRDDHQIATLENIIAEDYRIMKMVKELRPIYAPRMVLQYTCWREETKNRQGIEQATSIDIYVASRLDYWHEKVNELQKLFSSIQ